MPAPIEKLRLSSNGSLSAAITGVMFDSKIKHKAAEDLYCEAIALYSHFYNRVDQIRDAEGIAPIEKQEESDINDRYFQMHDDLESKRCDFIKKNPELFAVSN